MSKKKSCSNTDYTNGYKILREKDGTFTAVKGNSKFKGKSVQEVNDLIKKADK